MTFFERRYEILRQLEDKGLVRQLRVTQDRIGLRLGNANYEFIYGLRSVEGSLFQPDADWTRLADALEIVLEALKPNRLLRPELRFQWLEALDTEYDEARQEGALRLLGTAGEPMTDWSGLFDGELEEPAGTFQTEFGIVEAAEAPGRLARRIGRIETDQDLIRDGLWQTASLPPVALYCEAVFNAAEAPDPTSEAISSLMGDSIEALGGIVSGIMDHVVGTPGAADE